MTKLIETFFEEDLSDVETDPRVLEFVMRQRKAAVAFSAYQAQRYVIFALNIRKELQKR
jgi:hypothetical protein